MIYANVKDTQFVYLTADRSAVARRLSPDEFANNVAGYNLSRMLFVVENQIAEIVDRCPDLEKHNFDGEYVMNEEDSSIALKVSDVELKLVRNRIQQNLKSKYNYLNDYAKMRAIDLIEQGGVLEELIKYKQSIKKLADAAAKDLNAATSIDALLAVNVQFDSYDPTV